MAKTICTVCMGYLICNMPIIVYKLIGGKNVNDNPYLLLLFSSLFYAQCSFNFIIFATSNKQFREAYFMFLKVAVFRLNDDAYLTSMNTNKGKNSRKRTGDQSNPSNHTGSNGSGKPGHPRIHRVVFEKKHPKSFSDMVQRSEPCPGDIPHQEPKIMKDDNSWPLIQSSPLTVTPSGRGKSVTVTRLSL